MRPENVVSFHVEVYYAFMDFLGNILQQTESKTQIEQLTPDEERAIIRQCQSGELDAFGLLVKCYQDRLLNVVARLIDNPDDAREIAQDVFVKAMQNIGRFRLESSFYTWLYRIATNHTLSVRRRKKKFRWIAMFSPRDDESSGIDLPDKNVRQPYQNMEADENVRLVAKAIASLESDYRAAVVLRDMEQMSYDQISEVLEIPLGTVKSRIYRGREILKGFLKSNGVEL